MKTVLSALAAFGGLTLMAASPLKIIYVQSISPAVGQNVSVMLTGVKGPLRVSVNPAGCGIANDFTFTAGSTPGSCSVTYRTQAPDGVVSETATIVFSIRPSGN